MPSDIAKGQSLEVTSEIPIQYERICTHERISMIVSAHDGPSTRVRLRKTARRQSIADPIAVKLNPLAGEMTAVPSRGS